MGTSNRQKGNQENEAVIQQIPPKLRNRHVGNLALPTFSDEDADLREIKWTLSTKGYAITDRTVNGKRVTFRAHRVVLARMLERELEDKEEVDHRNRVKMDNRRDNLRLSSRQLNAQNLGLRVDNTSGHRGVYWSKASKKWQVYVTLSGKTYYGGLHESLAVADEKAQSMRRELKFVGSTDE